MKSIASLALVALLGLAPAGAAAQEGEAPGLQDDPDGGHFLFIPGIGRIPLPPGGRSLQPDDPDEHFVPPRLGPKAAKPPPDPPLGPEEREARDMARLFERLAGAEDEREAQGAASAILRRWSQSGSDTIDLLAERARAAETAGAPTLAKALLDYIVALSPQWPEGFVRRARVEASEGDVAGALADLETAARMEPKRFDALEALGTLAEKAGDKKRALDAWRKALDIYPRDGALAGNVERLRLELEGQPI
ncbi:MAG: tetratricopeptide repeat protein [Methylocystis sp.]|uniref:tetratricopeptide repeat protein n=1 Tax=Methylocystis sp. TaxID=1911079 RepID=UPI003DA4EC81